MPVSGNNVNGVGKVNDPTKNVLDLVEAAIKRQDDLRHNVTQGIAAEQKRVDDLIELHVKRLEDIRNDHIGVHEASEKLQEARVNAQKDLMTAEAKRIDALLAAAAQAVGLASEKASAQASALASQVVASAEALRAQVSSAASANTEAMGVLRDAMDKRITLLEQNQWRGSGEDTQRGEKRSQDQWLIMAILAASVIVVEIALHFIK